MYQPFYYKHAISNTELNPIAIIITFLLESELANKYGIEISENFWLHGARLVKDW